MKKIINKTTTDKSVLIAAVNELITNEQVTLNVASGDYLDDRQTRNAAELVDSYRGGYITVRTNGERFGYLQVKDGALEVNPAVAELIQNTIQNYTGELQ